MGAPERKAHAAEPRREDPSEDAVQEGQVRQGPGRDVVGRGAVRQGRAQGDHPPQQGRPQEVAPGESRREDGARQVALGWKTTKGPSIRTVPSLFPGAV